MTNGASLNQNASMSDELQLYKQATRLANSFLRCLGESDSMQEALSAVTKRIRQYVGCQNCAIFLVDDYDPEMMILTASSNPNDQPNRFVAKEIHATVGGGITAWCASQGAPGRLSSSQILQSSYHSKKTPDHLGGRALQSILWAPLFTPSDESFRGLLKCENKFSENGCPSEETSFSRHDEQLVSLLLPTISTIAAWPEAKSDMIGDARKLVRILALDRIKDRSSPDRLLQILIDNSVRIIGGDRGDLAWWIGDRAELVYAASSGPIQTAAVADDSIVPKESFVRPLFEQVTRDYEIDNKIEMRGCDKYLMAHPDVKSEMAVRVDLHENPVGVLNIESFEEGYFNDGEHLEALRILSKAAALVVQRVQSDRLKLKAVEHDEDGQPTKILQPILNGILEAFGYDAGLLYRYEKRYNLLRVSAYASTPGPSTDLANFVHVLDKPSFAASVFRQKGDAHPVEVEDPYNSDRFDFDENGLTTWNIKGPVIGYPIRFRGRPIGCLVLWTVKRFPPRHLPRVKRLEVFAGLAAAKIAYWQAEAEIHRQKKFYEFIANKSPIMMFTKAIKQWQVEDQIPAGLLVGSPKPVFDWFNEAFGNHIGEKSLARLRQHEELTDWDVFPDHATGYYKDDLATIAGEGIDHKRELHTCPKDGTLREVRVWKRLLDDPDGDKRIIVLFWDRTEESKLEEENLDWNRDFKHRVISFVNGFLRLTQNHFHRHLKEAAINPVKDLKLRSESVAILIKLLYETRGQQNLSTKSLLDEVSEATETIYGLDNALVSREFEEIEMAPNSSQICGQIVAELLSNCLLYAFEGLDEKHQRKISISLKKSDEQCYLEVADNGKGIDISLEERYESPDVGIGLVKRQVERHLQGTISLETVYPTGTRWIIKFPYNPRKADVQLVSGGPCIVMAEDDPQLGDEYRSHLEDAGFSVLGPYANSELFKDAFNRSRASIAILDIGLADGLEGGIEIGRWIRQLPDERQRTNIIFVTQGDPDAGSPTIQAASNLAGADLFFKNIRTPDELVFKAKAFLRDQIVGDKLFICYPRSLENYCKSLHSQLLTHQLLNVDPWSDQDLKEGVFWKKEIDERMRNAVAVILLVSKEFITSDFIQRVELPEILRQQAIKGTRVYPVWVSHTGTSLPDGGDLADLNFFGSRDRPWSLMEHAELEKSMYDLAKTVEEDLSWMKD